MNDTNIQEQSAFTRLVNSPLRFGPYLLMKLPSAFFSGVRVVSIDETQCTTKVPYKWFSQNPFRSTYFACLAMAAEMSTGLLTLNCVYHRKPPVSTLVTGLEAVYFKKAVEITFFTCNDGKAIARAINLAITTGEAQTFQALSVGINAAGEKIAEFRITWSFKAK